MEKNNEASNQKINIIEPKQTQSNSSQHPVENIDVHYSQPPEHTLLQKTNKKWLLFSLTSIVVLALGATGFFAYKYYHLKQIKLETPPTQTPIVTSSPEQKSSPTIKVEQSLTAFAKDGKIYLLDELNNETITIDEGTQASLSHDQKKIAYVKMDKDNNIYIYDRSSNEIESITTDAWRLRGVQWSPMSNYLLTDSGSDIDGSGAIYGYPSGKKGQVFQISARKLQWINNNEFVFVEPQQVEQQRPIGSAKGLSKISIINGTKKILAQANNFENYNLLNVENGIIYFSKTSVADSNDWRMQDKQTISYWQMNADGTEKIEVNKPEN